MVPSRRIALLFFFILPGFFVINGDNNFPKRPASPSLQRLLSLKASENVQANPNGPTPTRPSVYHVTTYGADPTGKIDSTDFILQAVSDALNGPGNGVMMEGIVNLGGARIDLDGGNYLISRSIKFPVNGRGNLVIHGGSLTASDTFPNDGYLIDLSYPSNNTDSSSPSNKYDYEFITLRDLYLDSNYRGGGFRVANSLRTSIDNCYITHFNTTGIYVDKGHETYIRSTYLGQHITAGGDHGEREFSGTGIVLNGNDNSVTDVVIFSAETGIVISGQANTLSGVHCYNKATGFGGTGVYLQLPGLTQTRIINSYFDYTGIVAEDPVQLTISNSFFLGDAFILLKSVKGKVSGVSIVDNMFAGSENGVAIVQLDQVKSNFTEIDQVYIDRNSVNGMSMRATVARGGAQGNGTTWTADFSSVLVFPNLITNVQYSFVTNDHLKFPVHTLNGVTGNRVVVQADMAVNASVYVTVDQGGSFKY